jgi:DNA-binding beta-propeller fold protein YncE
VTACGLAAGCAGTATPVAAPAARAPFVYVTAKGPNEVCQFGSLSAKPASTAATVLHPEAIALAPDGNNAYVTSENKGVLSQFAISPATGKITPLSPATVTIPPSGSLGVAVTPAK